MNMCAGNEHVLLITSKGRLLAFGGGRCVYDSHRVDSQSLWFASSRGQLGHDSLHDEPLPRVIDTGSDDSGAYSAAPTLRFVSCATGGWHSVALSDEGDVYVCGWNESGQLGLSVDEVILDCWCFFVSSDLYHNGPKCVQQPTCTVLSPLDLPDGVVVERVQCLQRGTLLHTSE